MDDKIPLRFDDRQVIADRIEEAIAQGVKLDELDAALARLAPVDLDLLHAAIALHLRRRRFPRQAV